MAADAESHAIPFRLHGGHLIIVQGSIGPLTELNLVIDTGSSSTVISEQVAKRLKLKGHTRKVLALGKRVPIQEVVLGSYGLIWVPVTESTTGILRRTKSSSCWEEEARALRSKILRSPKSVGSSLKVREENNVRTSKARKRTKAVDYRERLMARLKDPEEAAAYVNAAFEEQDMPEVLLIALRDVAEANGIAKIARKAGINRVSIYKALSRKGNPELDTLQKILNAVGLKVSIRAA